ncbi:hypothetical protein FHG87_017040 [Trinorchestia longiramus]|nr:hypothetical protein FHG87_017040 [Trinorchestia longiramus]
MARSKDLTFDTQNERHTLIFTALPPPDEHLCSDLPRLYTSLALRLQFTCNSLILVAEHHIGSGHKPIKDRAMFSTQVERSYSKFVLRDSTRRTCSESHGSTTNEYRDEASLYRPMSKQDTGSERR